MAKHALVIGMSHLDSGHYLDQFHLCSSEIDYQDIKLLLLNAGFDHNHILPRDQSALTWEETSRYLTTIQDEIRKSKVDAQVVIYFSGHGTSIEVDGEHQQFLCFHDKLIHEREILSLLSKFEKNTTVIVILDACFSGGIISDLESSFLRKFKSITSEIDTTVSTRQPKSISFANIYKNNQFHYDQKILAYRDYKFSSEADFYFFLACSATERTETGDSCKHRSDFTNYFIEDISYNNNKNYNYYEFSDKLTLSVNKSRTLKYINSSDDIFRRCYPIFNNQKSNFMEESPIVLTEIIGNLVDFNLKNSPQYLNEYSMTWKFDVNDPRHAEWKNKLDRIDATLAVDVKYISFVFLERTSPGNLPKSIRSLYSVNPNRDDAGFGVVVAVNDKMEIINAIKPKRTSGKVSNSLG